MKKLILLSILLIVGCEEDNVLEQVVAEVEQEIEDCSAEVTGCDSPDDFDLFAGYGRYNCQPTLINTGENTLISFGYKIRLYFSNTYDESSRDFLSGNYFVAPGDSLTNVGQQFTFTNLESQCFDSCHTYTNWLDVGVTNFEASVYEINCISP